MPWMVYNTLYLYVYYILNYQVYLVLNIVKWSYNTSATYSHATSTVPVKSLLKMMHCKKKNFIQSRWNHGDKTFLWKVIYFQVYLPLWLIWKVQNMYNDLLQIPYLFWWGKGIVKIKAWIFYSYFILAGPPWPGGEPHI